MSILIIVNYRLYTLNRDVAQDFEKMTNRLRSASLLFRKLASNAMTIQKPKLKLMYKLIEQMLMQWSSLMEKQWRNFRDDFSNYLKYYIFECESILELCKNTKMAEEKYLQEGNELSLQKHRLFKIKDLDLWQVANEDKIKIDSTLLLHDKKLAFPKMLPKVSTA